MVCVSRATGNIFGNRNKRLTYLRTEFSSRREGSEAKFQPARDRHKSSPGIAPGGEKRHYCGITPRFPTSVQQTEVATVSGTVGEWPGLVSNKRVAVV